MYYEHFLMQKRFYKIHCVVSSTEFSVIYLTYPHYLILKLPTLHEVGDSLGEVSLQCIISLQGQVS